MNIRDYRDIMEVSNICLFSLRMKECRHPAPRLRMCLALHLATLRGTPLASAPLDSLCNPLVFNTG